MDKIRRFHFVPGIGVTQPFEMDPIPMNSKTTGPNSFAKHHERRLVLAVLWELMRKRGTAAPSGQDFIHNKIETCFFTAFANRVPFLCPDNPAITLPHHLQRHCDITTVDESLEFVQKFLLASSGRHVDRFRLAKLYALLSPLDPSTSICLREISADANGMPVQDSYQGTMVRKQLRFKGGNSTVFHLGHGQFFGTNWTIVLEKSDDRWKSRPGVASMTVP